MRRCALTPPSTPPCLQLIGVSVDSNYSHLAFSSMPRNKGGLGGCSFQLVADLNKKISKDYGGALRPRVAASPATRSLASSQC